MNIVIPLEGGVDRHVVITFPGKLSPYEWDFFIEILSAMQPGLVAALPPRKDPS